MPGVQHEPVSVSLRTGTLRELREVAERRRTSTSKLADEAISTHLRALSGSNLNGEPLCTVRPRVIEPHEDPYALSGPGDPSLQRQYELAAGRDKVAAEAERRRASRRREPRRYTVGGCFVTFGRPVSPEMAERLTEDINRALALIWAEERERRAEANGA